MTPVWWLLAFIPALIALYFLKLKRQEVRVSSTYLWKRSLEDLHVNSPFQKLRQSLLLLLQLLTLLFLIAAIWQPRCDQAPDTSGKQLIVLIDCSASMNAKESEGSRLDIAKNRALALVEAMEDGDRMAVRAFASRLWVVQPQTGNKALLTSRIRSIEPTSMPTDLPAALEAIYSIAETLSSVEVHVIGDGCYGDLGQVTPEVKRLQLRFTNTSSPLDNVGITEADITRHLGREKRKEVWGLVQNLGKETRNLTVSLSREGSLLRARELTIEAAAEEPVSFDVSEVGPGPLELSIDVDDALEDDNRVPLILTEPRPIRVWIVSDGNFVVENAIKFLPGVEYEMVSLAEYEKRSAELEESGEQDEAAAGDVRAASRLFVFDRQAPKAPPREPSIFLGCSPPLPAGVEAPQMAKNPQVTDSDLAHPVNYMMDYANLLVRESWEFAIGPAFHPLVESEKGALIGTATYREIGRSPVRAVFVGFDVLESNWPINNASFPIFFINAVEWLGTAEEDTRSVWRTGESLVAPLPARTDLEETESLSFELPGGEEQPAVVERSGAAVQFRGCRVDRHVSTARWGREPAGVSGRAPVARGVAARAEGGAAVRRDLGHRRDATRDRADGHLVLVRARRARDPPARMVGL